MVGAAIASLALYALAWSPGIAPLSQPAARRATDCRLQFKVPWSTDSAAETQAAASKDSGIDPAEYARQTRDAANAHLAEVGAHVGGAGTGEQRASFMRQIWNVDSIPTVPAEVRPPAMATGRRPQTIRFPSPLPRADAS